MFDASNCLEKLFGSIRILSPSHSIVFNQRIRPLATNNPNIAVHKFPMLLYCWWCGDNILYHIHLGVGPAYNGPTIHIVSSIELI